MLLDPSPPFIFITLTQTAPQPLPPPLHNFLTGNPVQTFFSDGLAGVCGLSSLERGRGKKRGEEEAVTALNKQVVVVR